MADLAPQLSSASRGLTAEASLIPPAAGLSSWAVGPVAPTTSGAPLSAAEDSYQRPALVTAGIDFGAEGEEPDPSPEGPSAVLTLQNVDPQAEEPYMLYCGSVGSSGAVRIVPSSGWGGGSVTINLGGTAVYGTDYLLDAPTEFLTNGSALSLYVPAQFRAEEIVITVTALADSVEADSGETVEFTWANQSLPGVEFTGSGTVTIIDLLEGITLSAAPASTAEGGSPPGTFHLRPSTAGHTFCQANVVLEVTGAATPGVDYDLADELSQITTITQTPPGSKIYRTNVFSISGDADYTIDVVPRADQLHEGDETVRAKAVTTPLVTESSQATITIQEDYRPAQVLKEENTDNDSGCNRTCPTCVSEVRLEVEQAQAVLPVGDGRMRVIGDAQRPLFPMATVVLPLPADKAVPEQITVMVQAVQADTTALVGTSPRGQVIEPITLNLAGLDLQPGDAVAFRLQLDLRSVVDTAGSLAGQVVQLELLGHPTYASQTTYTEKISGWVGRASHAVADPRDSAVAPAFAPGLSWSFQKWAIPEPWLVPNSGSSKDDYAVAQTGVTILKADGSYSWYPSNGTLPPESVSVWEGNRLRHKDGSYDEFADGRLVQSVDPQGNATHFNYDPGGRLTSIVDPLGRTTTVSYTGWVAAGGGGYVAQPRTLTITDPYGAVTALIWDPALRQLTVNDPDPDGTGPRKALQEVYQHDAYGFLQSVTKGEAGEPGTQAISLSHRFDPYVTSGSPGDRALLSITRTGAGTTTLDVTRQHEALIPAGAIGVYNSTQRNGPRRVPAGATSLPYEYLTSITDGQGGRTIYRLDHRGRTTQRFDAQQVHDLGLDSLDLNSPTDWTTAIGVLSAHAELSYQYALTPTIRDSYGRVISRDLGLILSLTEPDPDNFLYRTDLPPQERVDGPLGRPVRTFLYDARGNVISQSSPLLNTLSWAYDATFSRVTAATDEEGNQLRRTVDPQTGLVLEQTYHHTGWHQYLFPQDVNQDGLVDTVDFNLALAAVGTPLTTPRQFSQPMADVNNDGQVTSIDMLLIVNYVNAHSVPGKQDAPRAAMGAAVSYQYSTAGPNASVTGLVTEVAVRTGRPTGDQVTRYQYYHTPTNPATNGQLQAVTTAYGSSLAATTSFQYDARGNVSRVVDPAGRETRFYYDARDRLTAVVYPDPDGSGPLLPPVERYDYNVFGSVIATELINSYVEGGRLLVTSLIDGFTYDGMDRLTGAYAQDPGLTWYLNRDAAGNLIRTSSKSAALAGLTVGSTQLAAYAAGNSRISSSNVAGSTTTPANDPATRGLVRTYTYDNNSNLVQVREFDGTLATPDQRLTQIAYDAVDRPVRVVTPNPGASAATVPGEVRNADPAAGEVGGYVRTFVYDNAGNSYRTTDVAGNTYEARYDQLHRPVSVQVPHPSGGSPLVSTISYASTNVGWQVTTTDPQGRETLVEYDFLGRPFRTTLPAAATGGPQPVSMTGYDADGLVSGDIDAAGATRVRTYNPQGALASLLEPYINGSHPTTSYVYSSDGLLQSVTDPLNRVTSFSYDAGGRLVLRTAPDPDAGGPQQASTQSYVYDALGNLLASTDALAHTTRIAYDARLRPIRSTDPANYQTVMTYDVFGNLRSVTDAKANTTSYTYDRWDRNYSEAQGSAARTVLLDGLGQVRQATDRDGRVRRFEYDQLYRPTHEVWLNAGGQEIREFVSTYDTAGNLLTVADNFIHPATQARTTASDTLQFVYDGLDQLQLERSVNPLVGVSTVLDRDYDLRGLETLLQVDLGGLIVGQGVVGGIRDLVNQYAHDALGRLTSVTQTDQVGGNRVAPKLATFEYNPASQLTDLRRYSATSAQPTDLEVHSRFGYDGAARLRSITHAKSEIAPGQMWNGTSTLPSSLQNGKLLAGYYLAYDRDNRLTGWSSYADALKTTYAYDVRDQVTGATHTAIAGLTLPRALPAAESYSFDGTGNRKLAGGSSSSADGTFNRVQNDGTYTYDYLCPCQLRDTECLSPR